jgi:hypothetical protein
MLQIAIQSRGHFRVAVKGTYCLCLNKEKEGYLKWLGKWVLGVKDRREYLTLVGEEKMKSLLVKRHRKSMPVEYGF